MNPPLLTRIQHTSHSLAHAAIDAGRAWSIAPLWHAHVTKTSQRPFTLRERSKIKYQSAELAFARSLQVRSAQSVHIRRMGTEGLLANFLHVLEVLHRVRPETSVTVDWKLAGDELGFRFGAPGSDVWSGLFRPIVGNSQSDAFQADKAIDWAMWGTGKDHLRGKRLQKHRAAYNRTISKWIEITNQNVLMRTHRLHADFFAGRFCVGVHRRVGNAGVANLQKDGKTPSLATLLATCRRALENSENSNSVIFLATDDHDAVDAFTKEFRDRLIVQDNVNRTTASKREVHFRDWGQLSLSDAEDVLVDMLLLSRCNLLVHASSSVSTAASLFNPTLPLARIYDAR